MKNLINRYVNLMVAVALLITSILVFQGDVAKAQSKNETCLACQGKKNNEHQKANAEQEKKIRDVIQSKKSSAKVTANLAGEATTTEFLVLKSSPDLGFAIAKNTDQRTLSIYGVDQTKEAVFAHVDFAFEKVSENEQILTITTSQKEQKFSITSDGLFDLTNNKKIDFNDLNSLASAQITGDLTDKSSAGEVTVLASCRDYVGTMCGLMAGYGMAELCALAALAGGLPGIGCALVYAAIATWGCSSAMDLFC